MKIRIITDSASDMSSKENLTILPMTITFGSTEYLDGVTLTHKEFYEKLIENDNLPVTSQIPPYDFAQAIEEARSLDEIVIIITLSSKLSGTYNSAVVAASEYSENVYVVDSENVCIGEKILIEYALELIKQGKEAEDIVNILENKKKNIRLIALLDTLEYLRKGGRISNVTGFVGGMLAIKPVIAIEDGEVKFLGKARGSKNANNLLTEQIKKSGGIDFDMPISLAYSGLDDVLLQKYIRDNEELWQGNINTLDIGTVGGTIGTHAGPGAIAVAFFSNL
ncbi:MAG: DegV family protein [Eubacterium sp.]